MRLLAYAIGAIVLVVHPPAAQAQQVDPQSAVVDAFERARASGDLSMALSQFADDAVITVQAGRGTQVFVGRDQVRAYLASIALRSTSLMRSSYRVDGPFVRWTERDQDQRQTVDALVQATIHSGRIANLVYQQSEPFGLTAPASHAPAEEPRTAPSLVWPTALGSAFFLLVGLIYRPRRRHTTSQLRGRLHVAMRLTRGMRSTT